MNINELRHKEVLKLKWRLKRAAKLCKAIYEYRDYIEQIKQCLDNNDVLGASELWNELDYKVQELLLTAPLYGGPFTTKEVAKVKALWEVSVEDLEAK